MSQRTVAEGNIIVSVKSRELPSVVVSESIPWGRDKKGVEAVLQDSASKQDDPEY